VRVLAERLRGLSDRAEFFLVITLSFAYFIGTSLSVLVLHVRQFELTTGREIRGMATEIAILLVVAWILRLRGWRLTRLTGRFRWAALLAGIPLFMAYYFLYAAATIAVAAVYPIQALVSSVRMVSSAPVLVMLAFILVNSVFEEALVTGYVVAALSEQGPALAITASTLLRLLYHLDQGPVASLSILPLGLLFGAVFWKWRDLWPLVSAHTLANVVALLFTMRT
jgi:membrane protease YdiL (CAAX protease family)